MTRLGLATKSASIVTALLKVNEQLLVVPVVHVAPAG
jgi:hypothetical protein